MYYQEGQTVHRNKVINKKFDKLNKMISASYFIVEIYWQCIYLNEKSLTFHLLVCEFCLKRSNADSSWARPFSRFCCTAGPPSPFSCTSYNLGHPTNSVCRATLVWQRTQEYISKTHSCHFFANSVNIEKKSNIISSSANTFLWWFVWMNSLFSRKCIVLLSCFH